MTPERPDDVLIRLLLGKEVRLSPEDFEWLQSEYANIEARTQTMREVVLGDMDFDGISKAAEATPVAEVGVKDVRG